MNRTQRNSLFTQEIHQTATIFFFSSSYMRTFFWTPITFEHYHFQSRYNPGLRAVNIAPMTFEDFAIKLMMFNNEDCFLCDTPFESSIKAAEQKNRDISDILVIHFTKMCIPIVFQCFINNNNNKVIVFQFMEETLLFHINTLVSPKIYILQGETPVNYIQIWEIAFSLLNQYQERETLICQPWCRMLK